MFSAAAEREGTAAWSQEGLLGNQVSQFLRGYQLG